MLSYGEVHHELETSFRFKFTSVLKYCGLSFMGLGILVQLVGVYTSLTQLNPMKMAYVQAVDRVDGGQMAADKIKIAIDVTANNIMTLEILGVGLMMIAMQIGLIIIARTLWYRMPDHLYHLLVHKGKNHSSPL